VFALFASISFVAVSVASPYPPQSTSAVVAGSRPDITPQTFVVASEHTNGVVRDVFGSEMIIIEAPKPNAPAVGIPDPGTAQAIAYDMVIARGWGAGEFDCLVSLWNRESGWNVNAHNASSGAHGIPQALPGEKMASVGADWATNPATQITWGLGYIEGRYGTPCGAWAMSEEQGWY
jgi:hypothetical protein